MTASFHFSRHGQVQAGEDRLSPAGREKLMRVRGLLATHSFTPRIALVSDTIRCKETGGALCPEEARVISRPFLQVFSNGDIPELRKQAEGLLVKIFNMFRRDEDNILIVGHDSVPSILGLVLAEKRGAVIPWENLPDEICGSFCL